jgi:hypothetical protein
MQRSLCIVATLFTLAWAAMSTRAQRPAASEPVLSTSGQFIVHAPHSSAPAASSALTGDNKLVRLEPALVSVSCERIKQALLRDIGPSASWRGRIYVDVRSARGRGQPVTITSERFKNGWQYRVELPELVERDRYTRAILQVLLLELANRGSSGRLAEVPVWLSEGLTQRLLASKDFDIILPPPHDRVNGLNFTAKTVLEKKEDPVARARQQLHGQAPLTFDQLSWQAQDELSGPGTELYRASAQLFVGELLRLRDGRACIAAMLSRLPRYYNWQLTFLDAFSAHFERLLDVEKWWALCCVQSPERELARRVPGEATWDDLDQALLAQPQLRAAGDASSGSVQVTLQAIIREWPRVQQRQALSAKIQDLGLLRPRLSPDLTVLVNEYCQAIDVYLQSPYWSKPPTSIGKKAALSSVAQEALQRLDALDARRGALRPVQKTPDPDDAASQSKTPVASVVGGKN